MNPQRSKNILASAGVSLLVVAALGAGAATSNNHRFTRVVVDFGIVCSDLDKSIQFYTDVVGATETGQFSVTGEILGDAGLTDYLPADIHVLQLEDSEQATRIKLMQFEENPGKQSDQSFVHATYGVSYLTVYVADMNEALQRAEKHGVKPLAKGPASLGGNMALALLRDPDGTLVELVGPVDAAK